MSSRLYTHTRWNSGKTVYWDKKKEEEELWCSLGNEPNWNVCYGRNLHFMDHIISLLSYMENRRIYEAKKTNENGAI